MIRLRRVWIPSFALMALVACSGESETAGPSPGGGAGSAGASGAAGEAGSPGVGGSAAGSAGAAGQGGSAGSDLDAGDLEDAGEAGEAGAAGAAGFGGVAGAAGSTGSGGTSGDGGTAGTAGTGGTGGTGGTAGTGGFTASGGAGGAGGTGGFVGIIPFSASVSKNELSVFCSGGAGLVVGSYTAKYKNLTLSSSTAAAVTKSHLLLAKPGKPTMSYTFTVTPGTSPALKKGDSATVQHNHKFDSGVATGAPCNYCGGTMTLNVEWVLSNGETRTDTATDVPVKCQTVT